ncbi:hypothetical protein [Paenibacillus taiwanensis]|uniref:hypothetical protein n=1 Tax=Paenibacillus taiwanensis TaxID=401638 RepID=UPI00040BAB8B|nr:hypothetical protein [Paenibacillus taiwanensis]
MKRKALSALLVFVLVFLMVPLSASATTPSTVEITGQGTLTIGISGKIDGSFYNYKVTNEYGATIQEGRALGSFKGIARLVLNNLPQGTYKIRADGHISARFS